MDNRYKGMQQEELQRIYSGQFDRVYRYALALTGSRSHAEEIAQEAFLRLCRNGVGTGKVENPEGWLIRVARNLAMELFRQRSKKPSQVSEGSVASPERLLYLDELRPRILAALTSLSTTQKECITLREYGGLSYESIANILNISIDQVKVQLFRARQNLRKKLEDVL